MGDKRLDSPPSAPIAVRYEPVPVNQPSGGSPDIRRYLEILLKRRYWAFGVFIFVVATTAVGVYYTERVYKSYVELQVEPEEKVLPYQQVAQTDAGSPEYIRTQTRILLGGVLAQRVAERLLGKYGRELVADLEIEPATSDDPTGSVSRRLLEMIEVEPILNTQMIRVNAFAGSASMAHQIATSWSDEFIQYNAHARHDSTVAAVSFLRGELEAVRGRVEQAESETVEFARQNPHVLLAEQGRNLLLDRIASLHQRMAAIETEMDESYFAGPGEEGFIAESQKSPLMVKLEADKVKIEQQLAQLEENFGPLWPAVQESRAQLDDINGRLEGETARVRQLGEQRMRAARGRFEQILAELAVEQTELSGRNEDLAAYNILRRESETEQKVYEGLLRRLREAAVETKLQANNVRVITHARVAGGPYSPNIPLSAAIAIALGMVGGVLAAFVVESFDRRLHGVEDTEGLLGVPTLGVVPKLESASQRVDAGHSTAIQTRDLPGGQPQPSETEFYRSIRSSLLFATAGRAPGVILVTSALPGEGKSATALNLAASLAQAGNTTLLVEADLHRPSLSQRFEMSETVGLAGVLTGAMEIDEAVVELASPNLSFLGGGSAGSNAANLITAAAFDTLIRVARRRYDHVVVDSAPQLVTGEAAIIGPSTDGVVLVVESRKSPKEAVKRARQQLTAAGAQVLGVVVNKVRPEGFGDKYSYYGSYSKYYQQGIQ